MSTLSAQGTIGSFISVLNTSRPFLAPFSLSVGAYAVYKFTKFVWWEYIWNPLNDIPGPAGPSLLYGHIQETMLGDSSALQEEWASKYGGTIRYKGFLGYSRLYIMDLKAINHILMNYQSYQRSAVARIFLDRLLGHGILSVEGDEHRNQRRIMNPAFGTSQIRELTGIFVEKALELRDIWAQEVRKQSPDNVQPARIDVLKALSEVTSDVVGLAGFNYEFNSVKGEKNELNEAFSTIFGSGFTFSFAVFFRVALGKYHWLLPASGDEELRQARKTTNRIGNQLLNESKAAVASEGQDKIFKRRDLLSLLVKANMSADVPESQRMSEEDIVAQIPTFLLAGQETTSTAITWALYALSLRPDLQTKLREELFTIQTDNPTMDELNSLPYLDAVVRETLRVYPAIASILRVAAKDDILPFTKPFVDKKGRLRDTLELRKGQQLFISILAINRSPEIWGEDAKEFKPERWESIPEAASSIPGVWGNMFTFLGGPRACIGFRFALAETKALLFTLVRAFDFQLAVPEDDIVTKSLLTHRPLLKSDPKAGSQMPLLITPYIHTY